MYILLFLYALFVEEISPSHFERDEADEIEIKPSYPKGIKSIFGFFFFYSMI